VIAAPGHREWTRPVHAAGMDGVTYTARYAEFALGLEDEAIKRDFPGFRRMPSLRGTGVWVGKLRPMAQTYDIRLELSFGSADADLAFPWRPASVRVLGGAVRPSAGGLPVPHLYGPWDDPNGALLCLYYPPDEIMVPGRQAAPKLLPWAYEWLYYYEMWLVTGEWAGPAAPHGPGERDKVGADGGDRRSGVALRAVAGPLMRSMTYMINCRHPVGLLQPAIAA
jgi:hypothetical protein